MDLFKVNISSNEMMSGLPTLALQFAPSNAGGGGMRSAFFRIFAHFPHFWPFWAKCAFSAFFAHFPHFFRIFSPKREGHGTDHKVTPWVNMWQ
jgi:hypothetical protein